MWFFKPMAESKNLLNFFIGTLLNQTIETIEVKLKNILTKASFILQNTQMQKNTKPGYHTSILFRCIV
jgi:hypothetical protein